MSPTKLINIDGTKQIETNGSLQVIATAFPAATVYVDGATSPTTIDTGLHFVVVTDSTGVSAATLEIGRVGSSYFSGKADDVRIYNRALSPTEVQQLYKLGAVIISYLPDAPITRSFSFCACREASIALRLRASVIILDTDCPRYIALHH